MNIVLRELYLLNVKMVNGALRFDADKR